MTRKEIKADIIAAILENCTWIEDVSGYVENCITIGDCMVACSYYECSTGDLKTIVNECLQDPAVNNLSSIGSI